MRIGNHSALKHRDNYDMRLSWRATDRQAQPVASMRWQLYTLTYAPYVHRIADYLEKRYANR
jgi:hypothetical protein